jgi:hypothetical protein
LFPPPQTHWKEETSDISRKAWISLSGDFIIRSATDVSPPNTLTTILVK